MDEPLKPVILAILSGMPAFFVGNFFSSGALAETSYIICACSIATTGIIERRAAEVRQNSLLSRATGHQDLAIQITRTKPVH